MIKPATPECNLPLVYLDSLLDHLVRALDQELEPRQVAVTISPQPGVYVRGPATVWQTLLADLLAQARAGVHDQGQIDIQLDLEPATKTFFLRVSHTARPADSPPGDSATHLKRCELFVKERGGRFEQTLEYGQRAAVSIALCCEASLPALAH